MSSSIIFAFACLYSGYHFFFLACKVAYYFISIKVRGALAERCAAFAWKGCKLAASGDFETITFAEDPTRQPGFLIKANEVEFLSPRKVEEAAGAASEDGCAGEAA